MWHAVANVLWLMFSKVCLHPGFIAFPSELTLMFHPFGIWDMRQRYQFYVCEFFTILGDMENQQKKEEFVM